MLRLATETCPNWARANLDHLPHLLVEQAHLEKKAAAVALRIMFQHPDLLHLQRDLGDLAREELEHFTSVLDELTRRGIPYSRQQPAPYAAHLLRIVRPAEPMRLLDQLLCNAAVEARSCERMLLLSRALRDVDEPAAAFYHALVGSEARHHELYVDLARRVFPPAEVEARLPTIMAHEAAVIATAPRAPGLHNRA